MQIEHDDNRHSAVVRIRNAKPNARRFQMDQLLCDELVQEIFQRLPASSAAAVSLVCRRWRLLLRSSTTSLSLYIPPPHTPTAIASLAGYLRQHPFLSSLSIHGSGGEDPLLLAVASSSPNLLHLLFRSPVSRSSLHTLSSSCPHLTSIEVVVSRPLCFSWLASLQALKSLCLSFTGADPVSDSTQMLKNKVSDMELRNLENLSLTGILSGDSEVRCLWRNCKNVKKLRLRSCESLGDYSSFLGFLLSSSGLIELELGICRTIVDVVLLTLSGNSIPLNSLLIHNGASKQGLLHFINQYDCSLLKNLNLKLPLDLDNTHLLALSENSNFSNLSSLHLESCCLPIGDGLISVTRAMSDVLEEVSLINCCALERERGLLTTLGQNLRRLRKLDLSDNESLQDKEVISMLASCGFLCDLKLRNCVRLTDAVLIAAARDCRNLQYLDIRMCCGIGMDGVEYVVVQSGCLRCVEVEKSKVSQMVRNKWRIVEQLGRNRWIHVGR